MNTLSEYFELQVLKRSDSTALKFKDQSLTYKQLNRRANRLGAFLREKGIGPNDLVAIFMDRSIEMIVAILGIIKAGGAYVPIDPSYPSERVGFMLAETQASVIITQSHLRGNASADDALVIEVDEGWESENPEQYENLEKVSSPEDLAYVMYTSGSTGHPKGVMIPHRAVSRLVLNATYAELDSASVVLQLGPVSFDASTFEIWGPLLNGGQCVLFPRNGVPDKRELQTVLEQNQVNTMWLTASLFNNIVTDAPETLEGVAQILAGGEALSPGHIRKAHKVLPGAKLINGYGPTETTTFAAAYSIPNPIPDTWNSIPIGYAINETDLHVLDGQMKHVSPGGEGELYIGGSGVALGYLKQPELTKQKFVSNPFSDDPEARLYRTGDLVKAASDGCLDFIGRKDDQVKLRGYRIELGEVEHVLKEQSTVLDAKVIVQEDEADQKRLIAYLICAKDEVATTSELRHFLDERVPEYMIPSRFVFIDAFPLTTNGKLDPAMLPAPGKERPQIDQHFVAPRNKLEKWLAGMWQDLLNLDKVGVQDRFFELGGDSLRAARFINQVQKELDAAIPLVAIYNAFSIEKFARLLETEYGTLVAEKMNLSIAESRRIQNGSIRSERIKRRGRAAASRRARIARTSK